MQSEKELLEKKSQIHEELEQPVTGDEKDAIQDDDHSYPDVTNFSKEELLHELQQLKPEGNLPKISNYLRELKSHFDHLIENDRHDALENFKNEGGVEEDFELKKDETSLKFEKLYNKLRQEVSEKLNSLNQEKEKNLKAKQQILDKLRELTAGEETSTSLSAFKDLQTEWKNTGPVPNNYTKELWANYNALVEMFYNNRSIYFELKELDRKRNLESKKEIIDKADKLAELDNIPEAIRELRKLHDEYKNVGPVPKEDQEILWAKFKEASDKIYNKRNLQVEKAKESHEHNLKQKQELIEKVKGFAAYSTDEINSWKDKTQEILQLQTEWKKIGAVPKERSKEISKDFWAYYKTFFKNKDHFFRQLEQVKKENLQKKIELCEKAESLKDSTDIVNTAETMKALQQEWNKIGPVPVKQKEEVFKRFKAACDHFFNKKREQFAEQEQGYEENLKLKRDIIAQIEGLADKKEKKAEEIRNLQKEFNSIGFVPKKEVKDLKEQYKKAVEKYLNNLEGMKEGDKDKMKLELEVSALKADPGSHKVLHRKEGDVLRKIHQLKTDIQTFNTNIDFLANSRNADKLKEQVNQKIADSKKELKELEEQLKIIRSSK